MAAQTSAAPFVPASRSLLVLRKAAAECRGCDLYRHATQTVFGTGRRNALIMLVGEQPGDREDIEGKPFVGPAGRVLDRTLDAAGIDRPSVYVTNAVKHFSFTMRGKRRLHKKPGAREIAACIPWLEAELDAVHPRVLVALGATAAQALLGPAFRITRQRGQPQATAFCRHTLATWHPSAILRARDKDKQQMEQDLVDDLRLASTLGSA